MGALKLFAETLGLLALGVAARVLLARRGRVHTLPVATLLAVAAVGAACGLAGVGVSGKRAVESYRETRRLTDDQRVTAGAAKVSATLATRGAQDALVPVGLTPTWIAFVEWARRRVPVGDTFEALLSRRALESQVAFWLNWRMSPRNAVVQRDDADWLIVMDRRPPADVPARSTVEFRPGYSLVEVPDAR